MAEVRLHCNVRASPSTGSVTLSETAMDGSEEETRISHRRNDAFLGFVSEKVLREGTTHDGFRQTPQSKALIKTRGKELEKKERRDSFVVFGLLQKLYCEYLSSPAAFEMSPSQTFNTMLPTKCL